MEPGRLCGCHHVDRWGHVIGAYYGSTGNKSGKNGGGYRDRTGDLLIANQPLSQLS